MQGYIVELNVNPKMNFRHQKAANSLDINLNEKLSHKLEIKEKIKDNYNLGVICGSSGSGKTSLAKKYFSKNFFDIESIDQSKTLLELFPEKYSYQEITKFITSVGLNSVPCWLKPIYALSNGQKSRAVCALALASDMDLIVIDEWTSVVDRNCAKIMSKSIAKFSKKYNKKIILISCHYDIIDYLEPDWVIDCNKQTIDNNYVKKKLKNSNLISKKSTNQPGNNLASIII